jgi:diguanylate cyclase (GGDEF)-like protein
MRTLLHTVTRQRELIEHQATHDALTGLPSLRLARDRLDMALSHALRDQSKTAVLFIDLDGFKAANDNFGHEAGDHVLRTVAQRLQGAIRSVDTAARQGGDEFIVISSGIGSVDDASVVAHKLVQLIAEPIYFEGRELSIGSSIGVAVIPDHASGSDEALRCADQAMYSVKRTGKNNFAMYTPAPG